MNDNEPPLKILSSSLFLLRENDRDNDRILEKKESIGMYHHN